MALRDGVILGAPVPRRIKSGALVFGAPDLILLGSLDSSRRPSGRLGVSSLFETPE